jgi:hypothetical protein
MITTTWQILWMPRREDGQWSCDTAPEPHPAAAQAASRNGAMRASFVS